MDEGALEFRIVDVTLRGRKTLMQDVFAYEALDGSVYLPALQMFQELGFQITLDADQGFNGWFLREKQKVSYSPGKDQIKIAGRSFDVLANELRSIDGVVHISSHALNQWFALNADWRRDRQTVNLTPPFLLPAEETQQRQKSRGGLVAETDLDTSNFVDVSPQYEWVSVPHVDANFSADLSPAGGNQSRQLSGSFLAQGDLLKTSARLSLNANATGATNGRLTLGRYDKSGGMLGPLQTTYIEAGDLSTSGAPLLQRSLTGVGMRLGSDASDPRRQLDVTDIRGDAPPGWEAELYRDTEFIGFQIVSSDGRYTFTDVALLSGQNRFRVELYGPSGERKTRQETIDVSANLARRGELQYNAIALKEGTQLFSQTETQQGASEEDSFFNKKRYYAQLDMNYGVTRNFGARALLAHQRGADASDRTDVGVGFNAQTGKAFWQFDAVHQSSGGSAVRGSVLANVAGVSVSAAHEHFGDTFLSGSNHLSAGNAIQSRSNAAVNGRILNGRLLMNASQNKFQNGDKTQTASLQFNKRIADLSTSKAFRWRKMERGEGRDSSLNGNVSAAGAIGKTRLRMSYDYSIKPRPKSRRASLDLNRRHRKWFVSGGVNYDFRDRNMDWTVGASRDFSGVRLGLDARHSMDSNDTRVLATLSFAIDRDPLTGGVRFGRNARSSRGSVKLNAFRDLDGNGIRSSDEPQVGGVRFQAGNRRRSRQDRDTSLLEDFPIHQAEGILVDTEQVDEPYLISSVEGVIIRPRPGRTINVEIPLIESGELEVLLLNDKADPMPHEIVTLSRCDGSSVTQERSAFDGLVYIPSLLPGCYRLSLKNHAARFSKFAASETILIQPGSVTRYQATAVSQSNTELVQVERFERKVG